MDTEKILVERYTSNQIELERFIDMICKTSCYYCHNLIEYYGEEEEETYEDFINRLETATV